MGRKIPWEKDCWQLHAAKARFSQLVRCAEEQPQYITVNGRKKVVILSSALFQRLVHQAMRAEAAEKALAAAACAAPPPAPETPEPAETSQIPLAGGTSGQTSHPSILLRTL